MTEHGLIGQFEPCIDTLYNTTVPAHTYR